MEYGEKVDQRRRIGETNGGISGETKFQKMEIEDWKVALENTKDLDELQSQEEEEKEGFPF